MNVFDDIDYRIRFHKCWEMFDLWKTKESLNIPACEHDMDELSNFTAAMEVRKMFDELQIPLHIHDELLIIGDLCCQNPILLCMFIRHMCDMLCNDELIPPWYEITSNDFMWVYPRWPLLTYLKTDRGYENSRKQYVTTSNGEHWYANFVNMMREQQDIHSVYVNRCQTLEYWMEVIQH